jgi:HK97 family phage prohead protease
VIDAGGHGRRPRKERFAPHAFEWIVRPEQAERDVHLLVGHSFDKPLASRKAGTLILNDTPEALEFTAILTPAIQRTSWAQDFINAYLAGLIVGISPGFRVAPPEAVTKAEETTEEDPAEGTALVRTIYEAVLFELSLVTRPAYPETDVVLRSKREIDKAAAQARYRRSAAWRWRP